MTAAILALADGSVFHGTSIGVTGETLGEVVFNTAMSGYQEMLTDPSYTEQILTLTYPHIGNVGCNINDDESSKVHAAGLVIHDLPLTYSNWRAETSLSDWLQQQQLIAIAGIDTRRLTRILREQGAQSGCIIAGEVLNSDVAIEKANAFPGLRGMDLAKQVGTKKNYVFTQGTWNLNNNAFDLRDTYPYKVIAYDFGIKKNMLRILVDLGCEITIVPPTSTAAEILALQPDGVFLSNGPGDPEPCEYAINAIRELLTADIPLFGICLGYQLLALAVGAKTKKMKFGHHGANHPIKDLQTQQVLITSQNHNFVVDAESMPSNVMATHISLFDGSLQGIRLIGKMAFGLQGHPEASPGPHDANSLFRQFIADMQLNKQRNNA